MSVSALLPSFFFMSLNFFREQLFLKTAWPNSQRNIWLGDFDRALRKWQVLTVKHVIYATRENFHTQKITEFLLIQDLKNSLNGRILWMHVSLQHLLFESPHPVYGTSRH